MREQEGGIDREEGEGKENEQNSERTEVDVDRGEMDILRLVLVSHVERVDLRIKKGAKRVVRSSSRGRRERREGEARAHLHEHLLVRFLHNTRNRVDQCEPW